MASKSGPSRPSNRVVAAEADPKIVADVARRYYLQDQSKVSVGAELGLSRFQVARMLRHARETGIVRIEVGGQLGSIDEALSDALRHRLGIRRAVVMAAAPHEPGSTIVNHLGAVVAQLLSETVQHGDVVGLGWSRVSDAMVEQLTELARCTVVQLAGHLPRPGDTSGSVEAVRHAAAVSGGDCYPIYAPMIVDSAETAAALRRQPEIAETLRQAEQLDKALVSVGAWGSHRSRVYETVAPQLREGTGVDVCGEIAGRLFDHQGNPVTNLIDDRVISITLDRLAAVPEVIATAWGPDQAVALRVAAEAGWIDAAVVDEDLARELLADAD